jgi:hypothetical protein
MSIISSIDAAQAAYQAALAAAELLPHQPPAYKQDVQVTRNDLQGNPVTSVIGAVTYDATRTQVGLETISASGARTGSISLEADTIAAFTAALQALLA